MNMQHVVDQLGILAAQKAEIAAIEKNLKAQLIADAGNSNAAFDGDLYRSTVSFTDRVTVDWKAVAAKLNPSRQLVTSHTYETPVTTVRTKARVAKAA